MTVKFSEAAELVKKEPIDRDIIDKLDDLRTQIDISEVDDFMWFYEAAYNQLEIN